MVDLLALAHDRGCEAELAERARRRPRGGPIARLAGLRARFAPDPASLPRGRRPAHAAERL